MVTIDSSECDDIYVKVVASIHGIYKPYIYDNIYYDNRRI